MSTESLSTPGVYGKVPSLGDFVSRNLPRSFIDPWDDWLQQALSESRAQLGEQWLSHYLNSPIWRFLMSGGNCGSDAWAGVMIPSVDRVGRYFPLTLAVSVGEADDLLALVINSSSWFNHAEALILTGLDDNTALDDLAREAENLGRPQTEAPSYAYQQAPANKHWQFPLSDLSQLNALPQLLTPVLLQRGFPNSTWWWTEGATEVAPSLLLSPGIPPAASYAALLTGDWQLGGWGEVVMCHGEPVNE